MKYIVLFLIIVLSSCLPPRETHCMLANKLAMNFASRLQKNEGLRPCVYGGAMRGDIQVIHLGFDTEECMNVDQIRRLIVHKAEDFMSSINNNVEIRPYLHDYPCTVKNIEFSISYSKRGKTNTFYPHISCAQIVRGEVLYSGFAEEADWFFTDPPSEPYEEALRIVQEEDSRNVCSLP